MKLFLIALVVVFTATVGGCSQYVEIEPTADELVQRRAVLQTLESVDESELLTAFSKLSERSFTRSVVTIQYDESGSEIARSERTLVQSMVDGRAVVEINSESSDDAFDFGLLSRVFDGAAGKSSGNSGSDPLAFTMYEIPEDRGYNNPRHENKYRFLSRGTDVLAGREIESIQISVLEGARDEVFVQEFNFMTDTESARVTALKMDVRLQSLLFTEASSIRMWATLDSNLVLEPAGFTLKSEMRSALGKPISFQTESRFSYPE